MPTVSFTVFQGRITRGSSANYVDVVFSEAVSGFEQSDVSATGATVVGFVAITNGAAVQLQVPSTPMSGTITLTIAADAVTPNLADDVTFTINFDASGNILAITPAGPFIIPVGTTNYSQAITITGASANAEVTLEGDWEGFYMDWQLSEGTLYIKSDEVTRIVGEYVWLVTVVEGQSTATEEIVYSVVPLAPVITPITEDIAIYRDVPFNLPVTIINQPDTSSIEGLQVGMKHEPNENGEGLVAEGMLPTSAELTETDFTAMTIAENAGGRVTSDLSMVLAAGTPPQIVSPTFTPKGDYGVLEFGDVNNALGYDWTLQAGDAAVWNSFSDTQPVIDPSTVEITPGTLNVTLVFPHISGVLGYDYMLESETSIVDWKPLEFTVANNMVTTIIPDLEEGVTYTLRLRVGVPWIGAPVSITITGGRLAYALHEDTSADDNHILFLFHTGTAAGGVAATIKRILIPNDVDNPRDLAIDFENGNFYILDGTSIHVFPLNTANDTEAVRSRRFTVPSTVSNPYTLAFYDGTLYAAPERINSNLGRNFRSFLANTANGQTAVEINNYRVPGTVPIDSQGTCYAADADADFIYFIFDGNRILSIPREPLDYTDVDLVLNRQQSSIGHDALSVIGNTAWTATGQDVRVIDLTKAFGETGQLLKSFIAPAGCTRIVDLVVER